MFVLALEFAEVFDFVLELVDDDVEQLEFVEAFDLTVSPEQLEFVEAFYLAVVGD